MVRPPHVGVSRFFDIRAGSHITCIIADLLQLCCTEQRALPYSSKWPLKDAKFSEREYCTAAKVQEHGRYVACVYKIVQSYRVYLIVSWKL